MLRPIAAGSLLVALACARPAPLPDPVEVPPRVAPRAATSETAPTEIPEAEPEAVAEAVPAVSAAARDVDADGIPDLADLCPGTPRGAPADGRGCWVIEGLRFAHDSDGIDGHGADALRAVAEVLRRNPALRIRIDGHTDSQGLAEYNRLLSERRARAVREFLIVSGIEADRVDARGFGETNPAADNATTDGRRANRRTEITVIPR